MRIGMLLVDGFFDSGVACVLDVVLTADRLAQDVDTAEATFEVAHYGPGRTASSRHGLRAATVPWGELHDDPPDVVVLPALGLRTPDEVVAVVRDHPLLAVVTAMAERDVQLAAACSGSFFLAEAGLLDGRAATTSWWLAPTFRLRYPEVDLLDGSALVVDGPVSTAGAAFSHIDLALSLVNGRSPTLADRVSRFLVVGDRPSQSAVAIPAVLVGTDPVLVAFERHVREHLDRAATIGEIAQAIGTSERTLQRVTADVLGMSPLRFVQQVRAEHARHLRRTTGLSTQRIAEMVGYRRASSLRSLLRRLGPDTGAAPQPAVRTTAPPAA